MAARAVYPIVEVRDNASELPEQLGTKPKFWFRMDDGSRWLFKEVRPGTGEHWSEKAASEIAAVLGLPHATYELATWRGRNGVVSKSFVPKPARLVLGNEVLFRTVHGYPDPQVGRFRAREHKLGAVLGLLRSPRVGLPIGFNAPSELELAADVFVGYLMLDALIANQDRHHENWGFVLTAEPMIHLAPTFDHGSSLGRNERDEVRIERLRTMDNRRNVEHYAGRARSAFYPAGTGVRALTTLAAFEEGARVRPRAARYWLNRLGEFDNATYARVFDPIPPFVISEPAAEFAIALLDANRRRLLSVHAPA